MDPGGRSSSNADGIVDHLPIGVFTTSATGSLTHVNAAMHAWTGAQPPSSTGFPWRARVNLADRARADSWWADRTREPSLVPAVALSGARSGTQSGAAAGALTVAWTSDDGAATPMLLRAQWVDDAQGGRLVSLVEPVSDAELSTATWSRYAAAVAHSPDATLAVASDGTISSSNPAAAMMLGRDEHEIDGMNIVDLIHADDLGLVAEAFASTIVGGPRIGFVVIRVRHGNGGWTHVEAAGGRMVEFGRPDGMVVTCRDVTARYEHDETREMVRSRYEKAFDRAPIGMALVDLEGRLVRVNDVLCQMVGRTANGLTGRSMFELAHPEDRDTAISHAMTVLGAGTAEPVELRFVRPDGSDAWARISSSVIHDDAGQPAHGLVHAEDITEQRHLREQLRRAATCDPLTGLLNRAGLAARVGEDHGSAERSRALMIIDLDGFKAVNDQHGHLVGDDVLCEVAARLERCLRVGSVIARIGGDEFAIYLPEVDDAASALALGERVRDSLASPHMAGGRPTRVAGSVGVAFLEGPVELSDALAAADLASYRAKRSGGNTACLTWRSAAGVSG